MRIDINYLCEEIHRAIRKHQILTEGKLTKNRNAAKNYIMQKLWYSESDAMKFIGQLKVKIPSVRLQQEKFLLGVARLFIDGELRVNDDFKCTNFNQTLKLVASDAHVNEDDNNLNGMSADELINRFADVRVGELSKRKELMGGKQYHQNREYTIVSINSFEEATKYSPYTEWCITHYPVSYENSTAGGSGRFYFCLQNGFENVPQEKGPNAPLDEYGLSMIAVCVTMEGEVKSITCRWNHDNQGNDHIMDDEQLSDLLGVNFYNVFKPYTRDELHAKGFVLFDEVQEMLDKGIELLDIFDGVYDIGLDKIELVSLNKKVNLLKNQNQLLSDIWFDDCQNFVRGYAKVELNRKNNLIDTNGKLFSDTWFDYCGSFVDECVVVELNKKYNIFNKNGKPISDIWFDACIPLSDNRLKVQLDNKFNFINTDGQPISDMWFDYCSIFIDGYANVKLNGKYNILDITGKLFSREWFDYCGMFNDGIARIQLNGKWNFIGINGTPITDMWFDNCDDFHNGFARVQLHNKWNFIDKDGNFLSKQWFDECESFYNRHYAKVQLNGETTLINTNGKLYSKMP